MNWEEISEIIWDEKWAVIAIIVSPWHLMGVLSFLYSLQKEKKDTRSLVIVIPHAKDGYLLDEDHLMPLDVRIVRYTPSLNRVKPFILLKGWLKYCVKRLLLGNFSKNRENIYFLSPLNPEVYFLLLLTSQANMNFREIELVIIDEGVGSYMPASYWKKINESEQNQRKKHLRKCINSVIKKLLLKPFKKPQEQLIFHKIKDNHIKLNDEVARNYKNFFSEMYSKIYNVVPMCNLLKNKERKNIAIYLSQPVVEFGLMQRDAYIRVLNQLKTICNNKGYELYVKPHPREDKETYVNTDIAILQSAHVAEAMIEEMNPKFVIGMTSTCLITFPCLFNVPSFSLVDALNSELNRDGVFYSSFDYFKKRFGEYVNFPHSLDDFEMKI